MAGAILERESEHHSETESSEWRASEDDDEWVDSNAEENFIAKASSQGQRTDVRHNGGQCSIVAS